MGTWIARPHSDPNSKKAWEFQETYSARLAAQCAGYVTYCNMMGGLINDALIAGRREEERRLLQTFLEFTFVKYAPVRRMLNFKLN